jgi:dTDP-glucose 4,6-dehydratase
MNLIINYDSEADILVLKFGEDMMEFVEDRPGHDIRYSLNSSKIRRELCWKPKHDFEEALRKTVEWYIVNEWWWKPLADEKVLYPTPWKLK